MRNRAQRIEGCARLACVGVVAMTGLATAWAFNADLEGSLKVLAAMLLVGHFANM